MEPVTMSKPEPSVPDKTLETLARNFCREARSYGFTRIDYLRYVNHLLEYSSEEGKADEEEPSAIDLSAGPVTLPAKGEHLTIRAFDPKRDTKVFREWLSDDYGRYFLVARTSGRRADIESFLNNDKHLMGVIELGSDQPIGAVAYLNVDTRRKKAELRKLIGDPACRGTGLAKEATELWIRYGLTTLGLKKIYLNTLNTNFRNVKLNESLGFQVEGILRHEAVVDGEHRDVLRMGLWYDGPAKD
jgi:RimJ/RimL family protein N-acetyltransferase